MDIEKTLKKIIEDLSNDEFIKQKKKTQKEDKDKSTNKRTLNIKSQN